MSLFSKKTNGQSGHPSGKSSWTNVIGLLTLGLLIVCGGGYYNYISDKEAYLTDRNFRLLAIWSKELTQTLISYEKVFESSVKTADRELPKSKDKRKIFEKVSKKVKRQATQLSTIQNTLQALPLIRNPEVCYLNSQDECGHKRTEHPMDSKGLTITSHRHLSGNSFHLDYVGPIESPLVEITAEIEMAMLLKKIVTEPLFDDVLLADPKGNVVYQKNPIQFRWSDLRVLLANKVPDGFLSSLFSADNKKSDSASQGEKPIEIPKPALRTVSLGGTTYHLFIQPILIPFKESSHGNDQGHDDIGDHPQAQGSQWILAGLIPSQTFRNEYLSFPYTYSLLFAFLVLMLFLSLPLVRLWMMNRFERIGLFNVLSLALASLVGVAVLTFFFWDAYFFLSTKNAFNQQLKATGELVHSSFQNELRRMLWQLEQYDRSPELILDVDTVMKGHVKNKKELSVARTDMVSPCEKASKNQEAPSFCYGDYDLIFWMDRKSQLRVNWTLKKVPGVNGIMDLKEREYVRRILDSDNPGNKRLWHMNIGLKEPSVKHDVLFFIEPIISWTTGRNSIVLSMPASRKKTDSDGQEANLKVAAMETRLSSIMRDPVLPKGAGFAIFEDHDGRVLFHSQGKRNLRENFFAETDHNAQLKGLVAARNVGLFEGQYWGVGHQFYVRPIDNLPWSLVVYRDKSLFTTINFEILLLSGSLFTLYAIIILGLLFLGFVLARSVIAGKAGWMWPAAALNSRYHFITIGNILVLIAESLVFQFVDLSETTTILLVIGIPLVWIFVVYRGIAMADRYQRESQFNSGETVNRISPGEEQLFSFRTMYVAMVLTFLLLLSVWPASVLFHIAHQAEMRLLLKFSLLEFGRPLIQFEKLNKLHPTDSKAEVENVSSLQKSYTCSDPEETEEPVGPRFTFTEQDLASRGVFKNVSFPICLFLEHEAEGGQNHNQVAAQGGFFEKFHKFIRIPSLHGVESMETWGLISSPDSPSSRSDKASEKDPIWNISTKKIALSLPYVPQGKDPNVFFSQKSTLNLVSTVPHPSGKPGRFGSLFSGSSVSWYVVFSIFLWLIWLVQRGIFRRIFFLDTDGRNPGAPRLIDPAGKNVNTPHLFILGPPGAGKSRWLETEMRDTWIWEDLRKIIDSSQKPYWSRSIIDRLQEDTPVLAIDHFEYQLGMQDQDEEKQRLLRQLLLKKNIRVIILSSVDPTRMKAIANRSSQSMENPTISMSEYSKDSQSWSALLESFVILHYREPDEVKKVDLPPSYSGQQKEGSGPSQDLPGPLLEGLQNECRVDQHMRNLGRWLFTQDSWQSMTEDQFYSYLLDLARPHYQTIWSACTLDERLALFFLAKDRFLHFRHPGIPTALQKGLIVWGPDLRLMNESFREFVLGVGLQEDLMKYEKADGDSLWTLIRWPLILVLLVGIVFLVGTQQEFRTSLVTLVSILPVLLPALSELPGIVQGNRVSAGTES